MNPDDQQDRIDDYLSGRLADPESFERELAINPQLQSDMEATRLALDAIHFGETQRLKDRLRQLDAGRTTATAPPKEAKVVSIDRKRNRSWLPLAAAASVLLLVAAFFLLRPSADDPAVLAMASFEPYPNIALPITKGGSPEADRATAYIAYEQQDYAAAEAAFRAYDSAPAEADADRFYLAQSLLAQENFTEAAPLFESLAAQADFNLHEESAYYGALARLGLGERERSVRVLEGITADANHPNYSEAVDLLEAL